MSIPFSGGPYIPPDFSLVILLDSYIPPKLPEYRGNVPRFEVYPAVP